MDKIEEAYRKQIARMSGKERVARSLSLYAAVYAMVKKKIRQENIELTERELKCKIAGHFYRTDPAALALLTRRK